MKLLISSFFSILLSPTSPNTLLNNLFSDTLNLHSSLNVRDRVPHSHQTTGKFIAAYVLIKFAKRRHEDERF